MGVEEALPKQALEGEQAHRLPRVQEVEALDVERLPDAVASQRLVPGLARGAHLSKREEEGEEEDADR